MATLNLPIWYSQCSQRPLLKSSFWWWFRIGESSQWAEESVLKRKVNWPHGLQTIELKLFCRQLDWPMLIPNKRRFWVTVDVATPKDDSHTTRSFLSKENKTWQTSQRFQANHSDITRPKTSTNCSLEVNLPRECTRIRKFKLLNAGVTCICPRVQVKEISNNHHKKQDEAFIFLPY